MSVLLASMIAASAIPAVSATGGTTAKQPCVVDYFNSFNGFVKAKDHGSAPQGFDANNLQGLGYRTGGLASYTSADGNTCLKFGIGGATNHSGMMMKYDETIYSGKLRISFDLKIDNTDTFQAFTMTAIDAYGNNNVDDWMVTNGTNTWQSNTKLMTINTKGIFLLKQDEEENAVPLFPLTGEDGIGTDWHKYEFVFDFDNDTMSFALDLSEKKELTMGSDFKTLDFVTSASQYKGSTTSIYMDNLFIKHYPDSVLPGPEAIVDYASSGVPNENAVVYVSYSEGLNILNEKDKEPTFLDFVAVNTETGAEVEVYDVEKEGGALKLTFEELPIGTYKIKCDAPDNYKTDEGKAPVDSNTFSTAGAAQNVKTENVLISDDFENYNGGMPANAVSTALDKSYSGSLTAVAGKSGNAIQLSGNRDQLIYKLPYPLTSGKVTYEFDINHSDGNWFTGIIGAEGFETDTISASTYGIDTANGKTAPNTVEPLNAAWKSAMTEEEAAAWANTMKNDQNWLRKATVAVGCVNNAKGVEDNTTVVQARPSKGDSFAEVATTDKYWTNTVEGLTVPKAAWTHVKVEVDIDNAYYNITVGDTTKTFKIFENRLRGDTRYRYRTLSNGKQKWVKCVTPGIQGISLGHFKSESTVAYDNFKVYTDNSYIDYSDFNTAGAIPTNTIPIEKNYPPAGWLKPNRYQNMTDQFAEVQGKTAAATDKAMQITGNDKWTHKFSRPIEVGTPFEIEFDIKTTTGDLTQETATWWMTLNTKKNLYQTFEGQSSSSVDTFEGIAYDAILDKGLNVESTKETVNQISREVNGWCVLGAKNDASNNIKLWTATGYVGYLHPNGGNTTAANGQDWHHVKLCVDPSSGYVKVKAYLDGTEISEITASNVPANEEIVGIGFAHDNSAFKSCIDNLTVKATGETSSNVYVTDMTTVNIATAEEAPLAKGLAAKGQDIKINFSGAIESADAIKVYKNAAQTTEVSVTKTLSADKKTVTISFADGEIAKGDKLTVEVPNTLKPDSASALSLVEPTAAAFEVVDAVPEELKIENFRLYKYYEGGNYTASKPSEGKWVPVSESELKDLTAADRFKFFAKGYNTGDTQELYLIRANKENDGRLKSSALNTVLITSGVFSEASLGEEFTLNDLTGKFNAYLWEKANLNPLYVPVDVTLTKTPDESAE